MARTAPEVVAARKAVFRRAARAIAESGVKRRFVARRLGISYGYFNQVSYGHAPLTATLRARIAEYLGTSEAELFAEEQP